MALKTKKNVIVFVQYEVRPWAGESWTGLGRFRAALEPSWASLGLSWAGLGHVLGCLGRSWTLLGESWTGLGPSWAGLEPKNRTSSFFTVPADPFSGRTGTDLYNCRGCLVFPAMWLRLLPLTAQLDIYILSKQLLVLAIGFKNRCYRQLLNPSTPRQSQHYPVNPSIHRQSQHYPVNSNIPRQSQHAPSIPTLPRQSQHYPVNHRLPTTGPRGMLP